MNHRDFAAFLWKIRQELPVCRTQRRRWLRRIESKSAQLHPTQRTYEIEQFFQQYGLRPRWSDRHTSGVTSFPACIGNEMAEIITITVTEGTGRDQFRNIPEVEHAKELLEMTRKEYGYFGSVQIHCSSNNWGQRSFSLALVLAIRSFYEEVKIPDIFVVTGVLTPDGQPAVVNLLEEKLRHIKEARPKAFFLALTDHKLDDRMECCSSIKEAWDTCINPTHDYQKMYGNLERLNQQYNWLSAYETAKIMLERYSISDPLERYIVLGSALLGANHLVNIFEAKLYNQRMTKIIEDFFENDIEFLNENQDSVIVFFCSQAITHLDLLEPAKGMKLLERWKPSSARSKIHYFGTKARLARALQDYKTAEELYLENIRLTKRSNVHQNPRCLGDYAEFLRTQNRYGEALKYIEEALEAAETYRNRDAKYIENTKSFLFFYQKRINQSTGIKDDKLDGWLKEIYFMEQASSVNEVQDIFHAVKDKEKPIKRAFFYRTCYRLDPSSVSLETLQDLSPEWKELTDIEDIISRIPY